MISLEKEMQEKNYDQSVLDDYGRLQILFEEKGGYQFEARVKQVLQGLGLKNGEENRRGINFLVDRKPEPISQKYC
jgi:ATPase subunit of ABC transporter with duplicated ATPase domains